jgi:hypothetical protein
MQSLLLCLAFALGGASELSPKPADGTLIFLENCNSIVELTTRGQIGHAALVFHDSGACYVYEATPGKVRRVTLDDYYAELSRLNQRRAADDQIRVWLLRPKTAYTAAETAKMREYLDTQIGRRYSVRNYVKGKPSEAHAAKVGPLEVQVAVATSGKSAAGQSNALSYGGIHCAELTSTTLNQSGRYAFENCHRINPQALYAALLPTHVAPEELRLPSPAATETWCQRAQRRTAAWFTLCGWSCREAWAWCW